MHPKFYFLPFKLKPVVHNFFSKQIATRTAAVKILIPTKILIPKKILIPTKIQIPRKILTKSLKKKRAKRKKILTKSL